jgi:hypothetical protein
MAIAMADDYRHPGKSELYRRVMITLIESGPAPIVRSPPGLSLSTIGLPWCWRAALRDSDNLIRATNKHTGRTSPLVPSHLLEESSDQPNPILGASFFYLPGKKKAPRGYTAILQKLRGINEAPKNSYKNV